MHQPLTSIDTYTTATPVTRIITESTYQESMSTE